MSHNQKKRKNVKKAKNINNKAMVTKRSPNPCNDKKDAKSYMETCFDFLRKCSPKNYILIIGINFIVGLGILLYTHTIVHFFPHLLCLTINISITLRIGKTYIDTLKFLDKELSKKHPNENTEIRTLFKKYYSKAMSSANLLACIAVVIVFLWAIFSQHYIALDLVGFYAIFMVCISVSLSVVGYTQYLWMLWLLFRISKCSSIHYNEIVPANTPFLLEMATLLQKVKWCFFIEGFFYTFEYFILIPKGGVAINNINMPNNISFLITWVIILLVIVLAFPSLVFLQEHWLSQIIDNWKKQRIEYLSSQFEQLSKILPAENMPFHTYLYQEIIGKIIDSADYPLKIQRLGPMIVSIATICLHMISLLSQLSDLKDLFNL